MVSDQVTKLEDSLMSPWDRLGISAEDYAKDLTVRWESINALLKSGNGNFSIVKSTLTDTIEFVAWARSKRELTSATALIQSYMTRLKAQNEHTSNTERLD